MLFSPLGRFGPLGPFFYMALFDAYRTRARNFGYAKGVFTFLVRVGRGISNRK